MSNDPVARQKYHDEAVAAGWRTRELDRQITTRFVERGLAGSVALESAVPAGSTDPAVALRDPFVLEFIGLPDRLLDTEGPVFRKMHSKRLTTYKTLGFDPPPRR